MNNKPYIIGADEVGYGSLSGPLVVGGVRAPNDWHLAGLNDSKQLSDKQRRVMNDQLLTLSQNGEIQINIEQESSSSIDEIGVTRALRLLYIQTAIALYRPDSLMIIDGNMNFDKELKAIDYQSIVKADTKIQTVMAASIVAKVYHDDVMIKIAAEFPHYDWINNKGYGTKTHIDAIKKYGYCEYHRKSYKLKG